MKGTDMDRKYEYGKIYLIKEELQCNYYKVEQQALNYAKDFFKEIVGCGCKQTVNDEVLPITFFCEEEETIRALERKEKTFIAGGHVVSGDKQSYIRIGLDTSIDYLEDKRKQTIRHEIIHYYLWVCDLPYNDDSLEFWCLCYAFDAGAYKKLSKEYQKKYRFFKKLYDNKMVSLPSNIKRIMLGTVIHNIRELDEKAIEKSFDDDVKKLKSIFGFSE